MSDKWKIVPIKLIKPAWGPGKSFMDLFRRSSDWISVEERLPEDGEDVLAYDGGVFVAEFFLERKMFFTHDRSHELVNNVSHWMPLPEPPAAE